MQRFEKSPLVSCQSKVVIKYLVQLGDHSSGGKSICQGVCKFGIIDKLKICCVWDNFQHFGF